jgi:hypothetical protein
MMIATQSISEEINPILREVVTSIFDEMLLDYGNKFTAQWGGVEPEKLVDHWCRGLKGYTPSEIKRGLIEQKKSEWPPTLPQFKNMCRKEIDFLKTYYEALEGLQARAKGEIGNWSHPAVFWAASAISFDLMNQTYSQMKIRWEVALNEQLSKGEWALIPAPALRIENSRNSIRSKDQSKKIMQDIGFLPMKADRAGLWWAHKIMARQEKGDKHLKIIQIQFAKEALGLI